MRKLGFAIALVIVLLVAGALILPHVVDVNSYHNQIQTQLEKKLGRQVSLGQMRLRLFPPSFQVQNAIIGEDKTFPPGHPFATIEQLSLSVKLFRLLRKEVAPNFNPKAQLADPGGPEATRSHLRRPKPGRLSNRCAPRLQHDFGRRRHRSTWPDGRQRPTQDERGIHPGNQPCRARS